MKFVRVIFIALVFLILIIVGIFPDIQARIISAFPNKQAQAASPLPVTKVQAANSVPTTQAANLPANAQAPNTNTPPDTQAQAADAPVNSQAADALPLSQDAVNSTVTSPCKSSTPSSGAYTVKVCFTSPVNSSVMNGVSTVNATVSVTGSDPGVQRMVFFLSSTYLLTDYQAPYSFSLPTTRWIDGSYSIAVEALMRDGFTTSRAVELISFHNGITTQPTNTKTFQPTSGRAASGLPFMVMAAGDGAGGEANAAKVTDLIAGANPNLLLYLGDVYEKGAPAEFYNWYGTSGSFFDRFRSITDPTVGNHEYLSSGTAAGYFSYWDNIPSYYSFDAGGWHFISLNSNSNKVPTSVKSAQYNWLKSDLSANAGTCTIVYYHHPFFNIGPEGEQPSMADIWALMAQYHVSIVLNGHDHDYQRWYPLDGSGNRSANGITEFVVGGGGHGVQTITKTDNRVAFSTSRNPDALGALKLTLGSSDVSFQYMSITGATIDSGTVSCNK